jgi:hypothetical protein
VKRNYHTLDNRGRTNERRLAEFLTKNGQHLLPMVDLIVQSRMAIDLRASNCARRPGPRLLSSISNMV